MNLFEWLDRTHKWDESAQISGAVVLAYFGTLFASAAVILGATL